MLSVETSLRMLRDRFNSGDTRPASWRKNKLEKLRQVLRLHEKEIYGALYNDLHKSKEEAYVTELGIVLEEIDEALKNLPYWMRPQKVSTNLLNLPSKSCIHTEPLGVVLIIAPWNYPFMLLLAPMVSAVAAGNTVVLKPSEFAPATAMIMRKISGLVFSPDELLYVEGDGSKIVPEMMSVFRFDHIFFTGGKRVAVQLYQAAAKDLIPMTLELGGKSPCVVTADANLTVTARRIVMTKFSNAGQMCIAPDYLLVPATVKNKLVGLLKENIVAFFSKNPKESEDYGRIINEQQFQRLVGYLKDGDIVAGGQFDVTDKYLAPTLMENVSLESQLMSNEIFGPILPILTYNNKEEALSIIQRNPDPLAFYLFTSSLKEEQFWIEKLPFGGGCINNASFQFTNSRLPFGGRGNSGIGKAHGKFSFDTFSHRKSILKTPTWFDPSIKYPPFKGKLSLIKKLIG